MDIITLLSIIVLVFALFAWLLIKFFGDFIEEKIQENTDRKKRKQELEILKDQLIRKS